MTHDDDDDDDDDDHHHDADRFKLRMICWFAIFFCQVESDTRRPWLGDIRLGA